MSKVLKSDIIAEVAKKTDTSKFVVEQVLNAAIEEITSQLTKGNQVTFTGFGTFSVKERKAGVARNPSTGEEIKVEARNIPKFKAGKALKDAVK